MSATLTFKEIITNGYTYPSTINEDLQGVIYDWYQNRTVADDDYFSLWFTRLLNKDIGRYNQLLRIEPGYAEYDWAVTHYRELQRETSDETSNSTNSTGKTTSSKSSTNTPTRTETTTHTGTITDKTDYNSNTSKTGTVTDKTDYSSSIGKTGTESESGSGSTNHAGSDTTTVDGTVHLIGDVKEMNKGLPMSISYSSYTQENNSSMPNAFDWTSGTSQAEQATNNTTNTDETTKLEHNTTDSSSSEDTKTYNTKDSHSGNDTKTTTHNTVDGRSGDDTVTKTYNNTDTKTITGGDTDSSSGTENTEGSITEAGAAEGLVREIETGRDNQLARIMEEAKNFIINTNAWEWLSGEIDTCFMGVYDI